MSSRRVFNLYILSVLTASLIHCIHLNNDLYNKIMGPLYDIHIHYIGPIMFHFCLLVN